MVSMEPGSRAGSSRAISSSNSLSSSTGGDALNPPGCDEAIDEPPRDALLETGGEPPWSRADLQDGSGPIGDGLNKAFGAPGLHADHATKAHTRVGRTVWRP